MHCMVLGSGMGDFASHFEVLKEWEWSALLDLEVEELAGHARKLLLARYRAEEFLIMSGKLHFYEGLSWEDVVKPFEYMLTRFELKSITVTSASGGLSERAKVGEWCAVDQIWSIPAVRGLARRPIFAKAKNEYFNCESTTYAYHQGPNTGTLSEYRMLARLGADLIGMSMLPEWLYWQAQAVPMHFLSLPVCNYQPLVVLNEPSYEEVMQVAQSAVPKLAQLFKAFLNQK